VQKQLHLQRPITQLQLWYHPASIRPPALVRSQSSWSIEGAHYKHWATSLSNFGVTPFFGGTIHAKLTCSSMVSSFSCCCSTCCCCTSCRFNPPQREHLTWQVLVRSATRIILLCGRTVTLTFENLSKGVVKARRAPCNPSVDTALVLPQIFGLISRGIHHTGNAKNCWFSDFGISRQHNTGATTTAVSGASTAALNVNNSYGSAPWSAPENFNSIQSRCVSLSVLVSQCACVGISSW